MAKTSTYLTLGLAIFAANTAYHMGTDTINTTTITSTENEYRVQHAVLSQDSVKIKYNKNDVECLARNIYYEAGIEPMAGKIAVGTVTINRVKTKYWGTHICDVVYSKEQFSWTKEKKRAWVSLKGRAWADSKAAANAVLNGLKVKQLDSALFYHADYVKPAWRDNSKRVLKVGRHIFYTQAKGSNLTLRSILVTE